MRMKWFKWNRVLHRELGYLFFGMAVIYGISGIALNHVDSWNPRYRITTQTTSLNNALAPDSTPEDVRSFAESFNAGRYKSHYIPARGRLKIFLKDGNINVDFTSDTAVLETVRRRPLFFEVSFLHYNPGRAWTLFADLFGGGLVILAISGLFMVRGRNGLRGRGAWFAAAGILFPAIMLLLYL